MNRRDIVSPFLLIEAARIQHAEDIVFWEGSAGAARAVEAMRSMADQGHKSTTIKWDGAPAVIFGRNENGEFVFTDKSGFTAKGYDGRATSRQHLEKMLSNRPAAEKPGYKAYIAKMGGAYDVFEQAVPEDFRGYFKGDMLYFDTPREQEGKYVFMPNVVEYRVPTDSDLGRRIGASEAGVVIHRVVDSGGDEHPLENADIFQGDRVLVLPPISVEKPAKVKMPILDKLAKIVQQNASGIDEFLNTETLRAKKITDLPQIMYSYTNSKVDTGFEKVGADFLDWVNQHHKISNQKKQNIREHVLEHKAAYKAVWTAVNSIAQVKNHIIQQFDKHTGSIEQYINGEKGGEGYVMAHPGGDIKLVNRDAFTKANRSIQR